jgi:hypothetical protein
MTEKSLKQILLERRKYANYFEWPNKQDKERGVVECLFESMHLKGEITFNSLRIGPSPYQAPDCIADDNAGETVAIEVTEFVSREAIEMNQKGNYVYRNWKPDEVIHEIQQIITKKDEVTYFGGPYSKIVLVIHTDEIVLDHETYSTCLSETTFVTQKINEVFFLFTFSGQMDTYPYVRLKVESNKPLEPIR